MLLCNHEKIAVQIAHGYARASGQPMIAIVDSRCWTALGAAGG